MYHNNNYYDKFENFDSFEKTSRKKPKGFNGEKQHYRSLQDAHKARRKVKTQEKKKIMKNYQSGSYDD